MKVIITDREALDAIRIEDIRNYLEAHGWTLGATFRGGGVLGGTLWYKGPEDNRGIEILLPRADGFRDHVNRVADILSALEADEGRSQLEIHADLVRPWVARPAPEE